MLKFLIVGTGRCGTRYLTKVFESLGISCTHEGIFTTIGYKLACELYKSSNSMIESSWIAVPFINSDLLKDCTVVHLVRDPEKTVSSFLNIDFFYNNDNYSKFVYKYLPQLLYYPTILRPVLYYYEWNKIIQSKLKNRKYIFFRIEDNVELLLSKMGLQFGKIQDKFDSNRVLHNYNFSIGGITNLEIKEKLLTIKKEFGY